MPQVRDTGRWCPPAGHHSIHQFAVYSASEAPYHSIHLRNCNRLNHHKGRTQLLSYGCDAILSTPEDVPYNMSKWTGFNSQTGSQSTKLRLTSVGICAEALKQGETLRPAGTTGCTKVNDLEKSRHLINYFPRYQITNKPDSFEPCVAYVTIHSALNIPITRVAWQFGNSALINLRTSQHRSAWTRLQSNSWLRKEMPLHTGISFCLPLLIFARKGWVN